jgi:ABC-type transport system involved in multi-copper enzyme maturation permease subunit
MSTTLLHYRTWQGQFRSPLWSIWPIARVALTVLLQRKLFWVLYAFAMLLFMVFFFGFYLFAWAEARPQLANFRIGKVNPTQAQVQDFFRRSRGVLGGGHDTFQVFFAYQGAMVVVTLALAGATLVGSDFAARGLPFYLAKPISRWHYIGGKCLAVAAVVTLMTTVPALGLYAQHAFDDWEYLINADYFLDAGLSNSRAGLPLLVGVIGYGSVFAVVLSILLVTTASWMRRTIPLVMVWMSLFFFLRLVARLLVEALKYDVHWALLDLWNDMCLVGQWCLSIDHETIRPLPQPEFWEAGLVLAGVCTLCLIYLSRRTRGVEVVR